MKEKLTARNAEIKNLKVVLRSSQTSRYHSVIQLDNVLSSTTDRKAFIYLLDMFDTEKELTKELLEDLIDHTVEFNELLIEIIRIDLVKGHEGLSDKLLQFFQVKNLKNIIVLAIFIGLVISVSNSEDLSANILKYIGISIVKDESNVSKS